MSRLHRKPQLTRVEKLINGLTKGLSDKRFVVKEVAGKGRSVFLCVPFIRKDAFVLEYEGDYISEKEASQREKIYAANNEGSFILNFRFMGKKMAIDATRRFDSFSRLLNHSIRPNIRFHPPLVTDVVSGVPRIAAYALRDIHKGEELTMDYGIERGNMSWLHCEGSAHLSSIDLSSEMEPNDDTLPDCDMSFSVFQPLLSPRDSSSKCVSPSSFSSNNSFTPCMMEEQFNLTSLEVQKLWTIFGDFIQAEDSGQLTEEQVLSRIEDHQHFFLLLLKKGNSINQIRKIVKHLFNAPQVCRS